MARRTKAQIKKEGRIAKILVAVLLLCVVAAVVLTLPPIKEKAFDFFGIHKTVVPRPGTSQSPVYLHFIDVGQGHAALIEDNGSFALIDTGTQDSTDDLLSYLRKAGVEKLDYIFLTHPHADHIGGARAVVRNFEVDKVVVSGFEKQGQAMQYPTTSTFERLMEALVQKNITTEEAAEGAAYPLGTGQVQVVHSGLYSDDNYNLMSLGLLYVGDGVSLLCTGDAEAENELAMLNNGYDIAADVFLAGHHGSKTSNTAPFLKAVRPSTVVVSCGYNNDYGHPHRRPLDTFEAVNASVLRTDELGAIVVQPAEGGGLVYASEKYGAGEEGTVALPAA